MRIRFKQWAVDYLKEHPEIVIDKIDFNDPFFKDKIYYEIGSGKGEFITDYALKHKDCHFLAVERAQTIAGIMAKRLQENEVTNVRVFPYDGEVVFEQTPENSVDAIFLNFVDPWPKKKHAKRRLTFYTFLEQYYRMLKPGGCVYFKSDNDSLFEFTLEEIPLSKFKLVLSEENYIFDEVNDAMTGYESKFRGLGQKIHRIVLKKE